MPIVVVVYPSSTVSSSVSSATVVALVPSRSLIIVAIVFLFLIGVDVQDTQR